MLYFWSRLLLCALLIPLREHNGNIVIKKGNITFSLKQDVGRATSSACPGALFLWKLQCICFLLKKVQVYLPFKINMCLRTALNQHIFLRWIASFVVRKKEGFRVGCTWKNLGTLKGHYDTPGLTVCILNPPKIRYGSELTLPKYIKGHQWNPVPCRLEWKHRLSLYLVAGDQA